MANPTCRILWWALVGSLLIYVVVAYVAEVPPSTGAPVSLLARLFGVLALAIGIGTAIYRRRALSVPIRAGELDPRTPEGLQAALRHFIVILVLSESVGIYGLLLSLLSGQPGYSVLFCGAALFLMVLHRPTAPDLQPPLSARRP